VVVLLKSISASALNAPARTNSAHISVRTYIHTNVYINKRSLLQSIRNLFRSEYIIYIHGENKHNPSPRKCVFAVNLATHFQPNQNAIDVEICCELLANLSINWQIATKCRFLELFSAINLYEPQH
jgi:hypothetical protein